MQQVSTIEILIAELLNRTAVGKAGAADTTIRTIAGCDGVLNRTVLAVDETGGTTEVVELLGDEVGITIDRQAAALAVSVVCEIAISSAVFYI